MVKNRKTIAERVEKQGGPPATIPTGLNDVEAILNRWGQLVYYDAETGNVLSRYKVDAMQPPHPINYPYEELIITHRRGDSNYIEFDGLRVSAARFVWLLHHKTWPPGPIHRKDGDKLNDRIENLYVPETMRSPEPSVMGRPRFRPVGVTRFYHRWRAYVRTQDGKRKIIGQYDTEAEAVAARKAWDDALDLV